MVGNKLKFKVYCKLSYKLSQLTTTIKHVTSTSIIIVDRIIE